MDGDVRRVIIEFSLLFFLRTQRHSKSVSISKVLLCIFFRRCEVFHRKPILLPQEQKEIRMASMYKKSKYCMYCTGQTSQASEPTKIERAKEAS